jgi:hypothetical protein
VALNPEFHHIKIYIHTYINTNLKKGCIGGHGNANEKQ